MGATAIVMLAACSSDPEKRPSPLRIDSAKVGETLITITYSSPGVKGRKIFGAGPDHLVQYGEIWRTGANDATYITLDKKLTIDTFTLNAGRYAIFTIPNHDEWTDIFNQEWDQWGSYGYSQEKDLFRTKVTLKTTKTSTERMKFFFEGDSLKFSWEKSFWSIPIANLP